jgi:hypothetical protein
MVDGTLCSEILSQNVMVQFICIFQTDTNLRYTKYWVLKSQKLKQTSCFVLEKLIFF